MKFILLLFSLLLSITANSQSVYDTDIDWSNPSFIAGSNLPEIFQRFYINGDYQSMLKLTSSESRKRFGDINLLAYYQEMEFSYTFKVKNRVYQTDSSQILFAVGDLNATKVQLKFICTIEKGKSKMFINSISLEKPFPQNQNYIR